MLNFRKKFSQDENSQYAKLVLDAINALGLYSLRTQDKWQIVNYTGLDPWQIDAGISAIDEGVLNATLSGYRL